MNDDKNAVSVQTSFDVKEKAREVWLACGAEDEDIQIPIIKAALSEAFAAGVAHQREQDVQIAAAHKSEVIYEGHHSDSIGDAHADGRVLGYNEAVEAIVEALKVG